VDYFPNVKRAATTFSLLLLGEDAAEYEQLRADVCAVVKPVDIIEQIFVSDVVYLHWDIQRGRRLKWSTLNHRAPEALEAFLTEQLEHKMYSKYLVDNVARPIWRYQPGLHAEYLQILAKEFLPK
jgi:hypothetical protein